MSKTRLPHQTSLWGDGQGMGPGEQSFHLCPVLSEVLGRERRLLEGI
jgi:hypothetical protein